MNYPYRPKSQLLIGIDVKMSVQNNLIDKYLQIISSILFNVICIIEENKPTNYAHEDTFQNEMYSPFSWISISINNIILFSPYKTMYQHQQNKKKSFYWTLCSVFAIDYPNTCVHNVNAYTYVYLHLYYNKCNQDMLKFHLIISTIN